MFSGMPNTVGENALAPWQIFPSMTCGTSTRPRRQLEECGGGIFGLRQAVFVAKFKL
jgi:hypothetical protein